VSINLEDLTKILVTSLEGSELTKMPGFLEIFAPELNEAVEMGVICLPYQSNTNQEKEGAIE
jgi:hypothetical protein